MLDPRAFISAFLIAIVLPGSSLAGMCEANCRSAAIHSQGISSSAVPSHVAHHHHNSNPANVTTTTGASQDPHHHSVGHQCCDGNALKISSACLMRHDSILPAQKAAPKFQSQVADLELRISDVAAARENINQHTPRKFVSGGIEARVPPLRI
jgi:hypothetical protein